MAQHKAKNPEINPEIKFTDSQKKKQKKNKTGRQHKKIP